MLDTFQRYEAAFNLINNFAKENESVSILDIGSNGPGFAYFNIFSNVKQTNLDIVHFDREIIKRFRNVNFVTFNGFDFPFHDGAFDIIICSDTLEHVNPEFRNNFISQVLRISNRFVVFTFPVSTSRIFEKILYIGSFKRIKFLKEHIENGLPTKDEFYNAVKGSNFIVKREKENINRFLWIPLKILSSVLYWKWKNKLSNFIYRKFNNYLLFNRTMINFGIGYSYSFILERAQND